MCLGVEVGGWVASACVGKLVDKVCSYIGDHYGYEANINHTLKCLEDDLTKIKCVLYEADKRRIHNPSLQNWLQNLKDASYEAEDILDLFEYNILEDKVEKTLNLLSNTSRRCIKRARTIAKRFSFSNDEVKELNDVVDKFRCIITNTGHLMDLIKSAPTIKENVREIMRSRETTSMCTEPQLFGRDRERSDLIEQLIEINSSNDVSSTKNVHVLPVVGIGGVGKTTLVQDVYSNQNIRDHFDLKAWVCVFDDFDVKRLAKEIIESACILEPKELHNLQNFDSIQEILKSVLAGKKFLIVLDDVWNEVARKWEKLKAILNCGENGSRVVVTTRYQNIADMMGTRTGITLRGLPEDDYWRFFVRCAFGDKEPRDHQSLVSIGRQVAKMLGGNPLAAKTAGALLKDDLNVTYWREFLESKLWLVDEQEDGIMSVLRLSYDNLPIHLKQCFIYCSLFPKDYPFLVSKLVRLWIAQGFIQSDQEEIGVKYFNELFSRSFFQYNYVVHDLLHDLAKDLSGGEVFDVAESKSIKDPERVRHIYVDANNLSLVCKNEFLKKNLRSVFVSSCSNNSLEMLKELRGLRVLILNGFKGQPLPESIFENMVHLRYLEIEGYEYRFIHNKLPKSLCKLYHIQVICIGGWNNNYYREGVLPEETKRLINMRHLDANTRGVSGIRSLSLLQELRFCVDSRKDGFEMRQLGQMSELRELEIWGLRQVGSKQEACEAMLVNKERLKALKFIWADEARPGDDDDNDDDDNDAIFTDEEVFEGLQPHHNLETLELKRYSGRRSPHWWNGSWASSSYLQYILLSNCSNWEVLPPFGLLPHLKHLRLRNMNGVKQLGTEFYRRGNGNNTVKMVVFPSLEILELRGMPQLLEWWKVEEDEDGNVKIESFPHLSSLTISSCRKLIGLHWWNRRWASSSYLQDITLEGCLHWEFLPPFGLLPHLKHLCLRYMYGVRRIGTEFCGSGNNNNNMIVFPSLETLTLWDMPELTELWKVEDGNDKIILFPGISSLTIYRCPKLREPLFLPSQLKVLRVAIEAAPSTYERGINLGCEDVSRLIERVPLQNLTSIEELRFEDREMTSLPLKLEEWFKHLTSLRSLKFVNCNELECLPSNLLSTISSSSTLQELSFQGCSSMECLPEEGLPTSLQQLEIEKCSNELTKGCSKKDNGRDWHKISHIPTIIIDNEYAQQLQHRVVN